MGWPEAFVYAVIVICVCVAIITATCEVKIEFWPGQADKEGDE